METTQQPTTIGEMTPQHFETYIAEIIKHVTGDRFDKLEKRMDRLECNQDLIGILALEHDSQLRNMAIA